MFSDVAIHMISLAFYVHFYSYALVREAKKPSFTRLDKRTNEEVNTQTKMLCDVSEIESFYMPHSVNINYGEPDRAQH